MAANKVNQTRFIPFVILSLVTLIFLIWAMQQCGQSDNEYAMIAEEQARESYLDTIRRNE